MGRTSLNPGCRERPLPGFLIGVWALSTGWGCQSFTCSLLSALGLPADATQSSAAVVFAPSGMHSSLVPIGLTVPFPGTVGDVTGSRDGRDMERHWHHLYPRGYCLSPPPHCLILWDVEWLSPQV